MKNIFNFISIYSWKNNFLLTNMMQMCDKEKKVRLQKPKCRF